MNNPVANWYYRYSLAGTRDTVDLQNDCPFTIISLRAFESRWLWCSLTTVADPYERKNAAIVQDMFFWCEEHCRGTYQFVATDMTTQLKWFDFNYTHAPTIRGIIFKDEAIALQFKLTFSESLGVL